MYHDYLILVARDWCLQVRRHIMMSMQPRRIVVASLFEHEAQTACEALRTNLETCCFTRMGDHSFPVCCQGSLEEI